MVIVKGQKINDRYEIIKSIGEGGMANVYLAHDIILDRDVAVKILRGDLANDEKFVRRFQREALAASSLSHPNIVEVYDVGEDDGKYYIVMEYVEGKTLKDLVKRRGGLSIPEVIDIMLQLTSGLAVAHEAYIIHRDIKPQNIMILDNGLVKITDFGIAMAVNSTGLTQTNSVMGSVHYLPPEQACGKGSTIKSDIYSLGILMFELLTGRVPYRGENAVEIALKHMKEPLPSVRKFNEDIPQSIENIILHATAKNPKNRYNNVLEMYHDLETCTDPSRANERRLVYKYPEHDDIDDTKVLPVVSDAKQKQYSDNIQEEKHNDDIAKQVDVEYVTNKKKKTVTTIILGAVGLVILTGIVILSWLLMQDPPKKEVKIPDVAGMTVEEAEKVLKDKKLEIALKIEEIESIDVVKGNVVKTEPAKDRTVYEGTEITLYISKGTSSYVVEDFKGKLVNEVEIKLKEIYNLSVIVTEKVVEDEDPKENVIIDQSIDPGERVKAGQTIILYIAKIFAKYPDMVKEGWTENDVNTFKESYNLDLSIEYVPTNQYREGSVFWQSRSAGSEIVNGASLRVKIATAPVEEPKTNDTENKDSNDTSKKEDALG